MGGGVARVEASAASGRRCGRELSSREDDRDVDGGPVEMCLVHVGNRGLGIGLVDKEDVGGTTVDPGCVKELLDMNGKRETTGTYTVCSLANRGPQSRHTGQRSRASGLR